MFGFQFNARSLKSCLSQWDQHVTEKKTIMEKTTSGYGYWCDNKLHSSLNAVPWISKDVVVVVVIMFLLNLLPCHNRQECLETSYPQFAREKKGFLYWLWVFTEGCSQSLWNWLLSPSHTGPETLFWRWMVIFLVCIILFSSFYYSLVVS